MASIGGVDIGHVQNESQGKSSNLCTQPIPTTDSDNTILLDLFGTSKDINITGTFTGSVSDLNTFIVAIEGIQNGSQVSSTYVSTLSTYANKNVFINSFRWEYSQGFVTKINYTLDLKEGAAVV